MTHQERNAQIRNSEVVTTEDRLGGLGIGYLFEGKVLVFAGNGFIPAENDVFGMVRFSRDNGEGYKNRARKMGLGRFI